MQHSTRGQVLPPQYPERQMDPFAQCPGYMGHACKVTGFPRMLCRAVGGGALDMFVRTP